VTSIGDYAFAGCSLLSAIELPAGVTRIGDGAFAGCSEPAMLAMHTGAVVGKLKDADAGVRSAAVATLGRLDPAVLSTLMADHTSLKTTDAERVVAELRGSRWRRSGRTGEDGKIHTVDAELQWGDERGQQTFKITHTGILIATNGWWVAQATFGDQLASLQWRSASEQIMWHRL
jgi:hypothetical protein